MLRTPNSTSYFAKTLAMVLACCIALFLVQIVVHGHDKGQNEATCRVCHAAHIGSAPAVSAFLPDALLLPNSGVHATSLEFHKEFFANDSPSRAPPAA